MTDTFRIYMARPIPETGKPHLKLRLDGSIEVVLARPRWTADEADTFVKSHYGSRSAFASRYGFDYATVCDALRDDRVRAQQAGGVELVRKFLGLTSEPTAASRRASWAYHDARGISPQWQHARVFAAGMERLQ